MLSSIIYIFSFILLISSFLLIKKSNKKLNIIKWVFITFVLIFCLNSVIVFILSYIGIKSNLITISIIYIILSLFITLFYLTKERQKYFFNKKDLIYIGIIVTLISYLIY